jgi:ketosteroid isomerase-like protein
MSQQNVEIVQRFVDRYNERGEPPWAELHPDVVWVIDPGAFLAGTNRGHEGVRTLFDRLSEVFGELRAEIDDVVDVGESVVALAAFA